MGPERALFLAAAFATHAAVGYALVAAFTDADPRLGLVLALVPDVDFLFPAAWGYPFVHRGITHTLAFALAAVAAVYLLDRRRATALAVGLAIGSHLLIDSLSPAGTRWLFPLERGPSLGVPVHSPVGTVVLWAFVIGLLAYRNGGRGSSD